jgi:hypothetical protein
VESAAFSSGILVAMVNRAAISIEVIAPSIFSHIAVVCYLSGELPPAPRCLLIFHNPLDAMPVPHTLSKVVQS